MLCVSLLIISLDSTILNIALPALVRALHATESELQWIADAYTCTFAGFLLVAGSLGDRVGRKKVFCAGLAIFAAGSTAAALSTSVAGLVAARAVMGAGAACIMPATLSILINVFSEPREQARAISLWSATTGLGIAIGPIVGGWLLARFWWGSVFLVNVPVAAAGLVGAVWMVPDSSDPARRPVDPLGAILSTGGLALLLWAIIESPVHGWSSPMIWGGAVGAAAVLTGFVLWERHTPYPMLLLEPFRRRRFSVAMAAVALAVFSLMGALFVLTQYLQFSLGFSALGAGVRILPISVVLAAAAISSSYLDRWLGTKIVVAAGLAIVAVGFWQLATTTSTEGFDHGLVGMLLLGLGAGLVIAPATSSVMGTLPMTRAGIGSATNSAALQVGGAMGVAVLGSVLSSRYQGHMQALLSGHALPPAASQAILGSIGGALTVAHAVGGQVGAELAAAARVAFVDGMDLALSVGAVVVACSMLLVASLLPPRAASAAQPPETASPPARPPSETVSR